MQALSSAARQTEARHAFSLRLLAAEPMARLPYLSCLPFQEALALAQPFLSQPDGELRAQAVAAVVGAGRYEASSLPAILDFCRARENEQDPVRLAMLTALAALPPSRWEAAHLPGFTALIDAALRAGLLAPDHGGRHAVVDGHHRRACGRPRRCPVWWNAWAAWAICATGIGNPA